MKRFWHLSILTVTIILIDQLTKGTIQSSFYTGEQYPLIEGVLNVAYFRNAGGIFGQLSDPLYNSIAYTYIPSILCIAFFSMIIKTLRIFNLSLAYTLLLAGAFSNLLDRLGSNEVLDYLEAVGMISFNLADVSILIGVLILIYDIILIITKNKDEADVASHLQGQ